MSVSHTGSRSHAVRRLDGLAAVFREKNRLDHERQMREIDLAERRLALQEREMRLREERYMAELRGKGHGVAAQQYQQVLDFDEM